FLTPTPGTDNSTSGGGFGPEVQFSKPSGTFTTAFNLVLTADNPNAVIRYVLVTNATTAVTTNLPATNSAIYTSPIPVTNTMQVRARAFLPNTSFFPGPLRTESYIALNPNIAGFTSALPIIVMHSVGSATLPGGFPSADQAVIAAF